MLPCARKPGCPRLVASAPNHEPPLRDWWTQAPLVLGGEALMTSSGLEALVELANAKFRANRERTDRFFEVRTHSAKAPQ
jgi:hypothetical protein